MVFLATVDIVLVVVEMPHAPPEQAELWTNEGVDVLSV